MTVFPLIRLVRLKAATASSRTATLPMFVRSRPSRTRCTTSLNWARSASTTKRTASGVEMSPGEMQIDRRLLQVAMPEQHLNGAQVGTGFEQMRGKAVAQPSVAGSLGPPEGQSRAAGPAPRPGAPLYIFPGSLSEGTLIQACIL